MGAQRDAARESHAYADAVARPVAEDPGRRRGGARDRAPRPAPRTRERPADQLLLQVFTVCVAMLLMGGVVCGLATRGD